MTLPDLHQRIGGLALRRRMTRAAIVTDAGVPERTFRDAVTGRTTLDTATAARLLPLVAAVVAPGEPVALTLYVPGVATPLHLTTAPL
jgi:hypothetical protein